MRVSTEALPNPEGKVPGTDGNAGSWQRIEAVIEPYYPRPGNGRRPYPVMTMLRIHCLQQWYSLSDPAMEDALYEIASMRLLTSLSLDKPIPDYTTIMNFRHLLERNGLGWQVFEVNN